MQNLRGVIRFFTITLIIACLFQLSFTFLARNVENKADSYAEQQVKMPVLTGATAADQVKLRDSIEHEQSVARRNYLDSVSGNPIVDLWGF
ncbi:MAG TPA: hypothetical protein VG603_08225, partial [Chitinophagales bacterium]|nr:hypothetical protein [Chitinophagales bacterium]